MRKIVTLTALAAVAAGVTVMPPASAHASGRYVDEVFESVVVQGSIAYGHAPNSDGVDQALLFDLYLPEGDAAVDRPAIVLAHGGGFTGGSRTEEGIVAMATAFARRGYVAASISYRVRPALGYDELITGSLLGEMPGAMHDAQHDMQAAVRFIRAHAVELGVDPSKIVAGGISAGASMALEAAYNPEDPGTSNDLDVSSEVAAAISSSGATDPRRIEADRAPVAMFNGTNDTTAPYPTAILACGTATAMGDVCELHTYPGAPHDLRPYLDEIVQASAVFLCTHVVDCASDH